MNRLKFVLLAGVLALVVAAVAAGPASAKGGSNSANAKQCQKGGWQNLYQSDGARFASEEACVSYGAQGGTILTAPPNLWRAACEANGGTFSQVPFEATGIEYQCSPVADQVWESTLTPICFRYPDAVFSGFTGPFTGGTAFCDRAGPA